MPNRFVANATSFTNDGYSTLLGFADDPINPINYVMLNMSNEPDGQDLKLGHGGVHIDGGALKIDGYDQVQDISEADFGVVITLAREAAQAAGIDPAIEIEVLDRLIDGIPIPTAIEGFRSRIRKWEALRAR